MNIQIMHAATTSYRKTIVASSVAGLAVIAVTYAGPTLVSAILPVWFVVLLTALGWVVGLLLLLVALGGLLVNFRYTGRERGEEDLFLALNRARSEAVSLDQTGGSKALKFPRLRRWLGAPTYIVNDTVRIRSYRKSSPPSTRTAASMACHSCPRWRST